MARDPLPNGCCHTLVRDPNRMVWLCTTCGWAITDQERRMAARQIPRQPVGDGFTDASGLVQAAMYGATCMSLQPSGSAGFGYGATMIPELYGSTSWLVANAAPISEGEPANLQEDHAELRRIRAESMARQAAVEVRALTQRTEAQGRARALLVEVIGEPAVQTLEAGGTYAVPSVRWPGTEYHIPKGGYIKIVKDGLWQEVCLVSSDQSLPWADLVLSRIKMIEANETIVQGRGNRQGSTPNPTLKKLRKHVEALFNPSRNQAR